VLGPLALARNGEPLVQPITVLRAEHGRDLDKLAEATLDLDKILGPKVDLDMPRPESRVRSSAPRRSGFR
jgi:hypothetical protein